MEDMLTLKVSLPEDLSTPIQPAKQWWNVLYEKKFEYKLEGSESNRDYIQRMFESIRSRFFLRDRDAYLCRDDVALHFYLLDRDDSNVNLVYDSFQGNNVDQLEAENAQILLVNSTSSHIHYGIRHFGHITRKYTSRDIPSRFDKYDLIVFECDYMGYNVSAIPEIRKRFAIDKLPIITYFGEGIVPNEAEAKSKLFGANHFVQGNIEDLATIVDMELGGRRNTEVFRRKVVIL